MKKDKLTKMIPIRYIGMIWVPLFIIFILPSGLIFTILKVVLGFWIVITIASSFKSHWTEYGTLGAFVTLNTIWFACMLFINGPFWFNYIFSFLIILGFATMFNQINKANRMGISKLELDLKEREGRKEGDNED